MRPAQNSEDRDPLLMPWQVARMFRADPRSVGRWADSGKLPCVTTPAGRRFRKSIVDALLAVEGVPPGELLTGKEVAGMFSVVLASVNRWGDEGKITTIRTPGNHRRFVKREIDALRAGAPAAGQITKEAA